MPLDVNQMVLKLSPLAALSPSGGSSSLERQRLQLMREQFENTKEQQRKQLEMDQLAEQGRMARERMMSERAAAQAAAKAAAKLQEQKLAAYNEFTKRMGDGDVQGASAMAPLMHNLGMNVEELGSVEGLPTYQVDMDRQQAEQAESARLAQTTTYGPGESAVQSLDRLGALGLRGEQGSLDDPSLTRRASPADAAVPFEPQAGGVDAATTEALTPGENDYRFVPTPSDPLPSGAYGSMEEGAGAVGAEEPPAPEEIAVRTGLGSARLPAGDAYAQALAAGQRARDAMGLPARAQDAPDETGGVQRNVLDMGALHARALAQLNPGLKAFTDAYPDQASRDSAAQTADVVRASGLSGAKALELADKLRSGPDARLNALTMAGAQQEKFRETRDQLTPMQMEELKTAGKRDAAEAYKSNGIVGALDAMEAGNTVRDLMMGDKRNYSKAVNYLMKMTGNKGSQTEGDAVRVMGRGQLNTIEEVTTWLHSKLVGGGNFTTEERNAILEFVDMERDRNRDLVFDYLDRMDEVANDPTAHELRRTGTRQFVERTVPTWARDEYAAIREAEDAEDAKPAAAAGPAPGARRQADSDPSPTAGMSDFDIELEGQALENDLDYDKLAPIIRGESGGEASAVSSEGARGILQIMPSNLRDMGIDPDEYGKLSAKEQIPVALKFLKAQGLTADSSPEDYVMAVAASAPKFRAPDATDDMVVYPKGSKAWEANAPWRPKDGGDITRGSILDYYGVRGGKGGASAEPALPPPTTDLDKAVKEALGL